MKPRLLIDMNLSPRWVDALRDGGWEALHWSSVGQPSASDREIIDWAEAHDYVVFTNDLDFGTLLALSRRNKPSVIQLRSQDVLPEAGKAPLLRMLGQFQKELEAGALLILDTAKERVRLLPL